MTLQQRFFLEHGRVSRLVVVRVTEYWVTATLPTIQLEQCFYALNQSHVPGCINFPKQIIALVFYLRHDRSHVAPAMRPRLTC